ncbi:MAG TPA: hypothetical protein VMZ91_10420 [Candidatus Paceibacterota bacterium]|nr:hypothetical protein [Candidatus Paceibacterota bacterium]
METYSIKIQEGNKVARAGLRLIVGNCYIYKVEVRLGKKYIYFGQAKGNTKKEAEVAAIAMAKDAISF